MLAVSDPFFCAEDCLFEFDGDVFAQVRSALRASAAPAAASEDVTEAKELPENVAEVLEDRRIKADACSGASDTCMTKAVVDSPLLRIGQYRISFAGLFEFFFRIRIIGIAVRVELHGQLAVGTLDFLIAGATLDA